MTSRRLIKKLDAHPVAVTVGLMLANVLVLMSVVALLALEWR